MSNDVGFGKDLGLVHEIITMGRGIGMVRRDWKKLATNKQHLRDVLDFSRGRMLEKCPPLAEKKVQVEQIVWLAGAVKELYQYLGFCTNCGIYDRQAKDHTPRAQKILQKLEFPDNGLTTCLQVGECLNPFCEKIFMVENCWWLGDADIHAIGQTGNDSQGFRKNHNVPPCMRAQVTTLTDNLSLRVFSELCEKNGTPIRIKLCFQDPQKV